MTKALAAVHEPAASMARATISLDMSRCVDALRSRDGLQAFAYVGARELESSVRGFSVVTVRPVTTREMGDDDMPDAAAPAAADPANQPAASGLCPSRVSPYQCPGACSLEAARTAWVCM